MNDRNIYTNYDKNDNLISINFKNQRYDLTKMTKEEAIKDILKQDESIKKDIISGKVKFIKTRGHMGIKWNEYVDTMAQTASLAAKEIL